MAQKREKEETLELKVSTTETLTTLCPDNCKIPPPSTAQTRSVAGSASPDPIRIDSGSHAPPARAPKRPRDEAEEPRIPEAKARVDDAAAVASMMKKTVNRCSGCRKRVGLTGFRCRCGEMFCSVHRYSDRHDCGFDYKAAGREAIERDNPVVRAAKILKI